MTTSLHQIHQAITIIYAGASILCIGALIIIIRILRMK